MDLEAARQHLQDRLRTLVSRTGKIEADLRSARPKDFEDYAIQAENEEVLRRLDATERAELDRIRVALRRLADGRYETCSRCGGPIAEKRLEALPDTDVCVRCA